MEMVCALFQPPLADYFAVFGVGCCVIIWVSGTKILRRLKSHHPEVYERVHYDLGRANNILDVCRTLPKSVNFVVLFIAGRYFSLGDPLLNSWAFAWQVTAILTLVTASLLKAC